MHYKIYGRHWFIIIFAAMTARALALLIYDSRDFVTFAVNSFISIVHRRGRERKGSSADAGRLGCGRYMSTEGRERCSRALGGEAGFVHSSKPLHLGAHYTNCAKSRTWGFGDTKVDSNRACIWTTITTF